jgi:hypothetical protein
MQISNRQGDIHSGGNQNKQMEPCKTLTLLPIKDELACIGMLVLRGSRILVPQSLRKTVLELVHKGHPGIVVMKRNRKTKV